MRLAEPAGARFITKENSTPLKAMTLQIRKTLIGFEVKVPPGSSLNLVVIFLPEDAVENKSLTGINLDKW